MKIIDLKEQAEKQEKEEPYINILVSRKRIEWIACNFKITEHAQFRFVQRDTEADRNLKRCIRNSPLSWKQVNGTIAIAFDLYNYIVVDDSTGEPIIITFCDTKSKGSNVFEKAVVEYKKFVAQKRDIGR